MLFITSQLSQSLGYGLYPHYIPTSSHVHILPSVDTGELPKIHEPYHTALGPGDLAFPFPEIIQHHNIPMAGPMVPTHFVIEAQDQCLDDHHNSIYNSYCLWLSVILLIYHVWFPSVGKNYTARCPKLPRRDKSLLAGHSVVASSEFKHLQGKMKALHIWSFSIPNLPVRSCKRKFCWLYLVNVNRKLQNMYFFRYISDQVLHCTTASLRRAPAFLANAVILNPLTDRIFLQLASHSNLDVHPRMILLVHSPIAIRIYQIYIIIILYIIYIFTHYAVYVYSTTRNA